MNKEKTVDISKVKKIIIEDYSGDKVEVLDGFDYERKIKEAQWDNLINDQVFKEVCNKISK